MTSKQLKRLLKKAKKGDQTAFASIYSLLAQHIYYTGLRITQNKEDADDIVQETMLTLFHNLEKIYNPKALYTYTVTIARNLSIDLLRSKKRKPTVFIEDSYQVMYDIPDLENEFLPAEYLESKELRTELIQIIDQLQEDRREVIMLYYYNQFTTPEIAEMLDISDQLVRTRLYRARKDIEEAVRKDREKGVFVMAGLPILTQVLEMDASTSFSNAVKVNNWISTAQKLGFEQVVIDSTSKLVASETALNITQFLGSTTILSSKAIATLVSALVVGGAVVTMTVWPEKKTTAPLPKTSQSIVESQGEEAPFILPKEELEDVVELTPDLPVEESQTENNKEESSRGHTGIVAVPKIQAENYILEYPKGVAISPYEIIKDAEIHQSEQLDYEIYYYDQIDFNTPNEYGVLVTGVASDGRRTSTIALIIIIS